LKKIESSPFGEKLLVSKESKIDLSPMKPFVLEDEDTKQIQLPMELKSLLIDPSL